MDWNRNLAVSRCSLGKEIRVAVVGKKMRKGKGKTSKLLPNSLRIISSCIRNVSTNASTAVRSAGASVAASISSSGDDRKEQVDF